MGCDVAGVVERTGQVRSVGGLDADDQVTAPSATPDGPIGETLKTTHKSHLASA